MQETENIKLHPDQELHNQVLRKVTAVYENEGFSMQEALNNSFNIVCYYAMALGVPENKIAEAVREGINAFKSNYTNLN